MSIKIYTPREYSKIIINNLIKNELCSNMLCERFMLLLIVFGTCPRIQLDYKGQKTQMFSQLAAVCLDGQINVTN